MEKTVKLKQKNKPNYKGKKKIYLIFLGLTLLILSLVLFFIFRQKPSFTGERIIFEIQAAQSVSSGSKITYEIFYKNEEEVALQDVEIDLLYPQGFVFDKSNPRSENFTENKWTFQTVPAKSADKITISGWLWGNPGDTARCVATFRYKPENFNASFSEEASIATKINKVKLALSSNIPKKIAKDSDLNFSLLIKNEENFRLSSLRLKINYPSTFEFKEGNPSPSRGKDTWDIDGLLPGEELKIEILGKLFGEINEIKKFKIEIGQESNDQYYKQKEKEFEIKIVKIDVELKAEINGETIGLINPGDEFQGKISYKNTGTESIPNVRVEWELPEKFFDIQSFIVEGGEYKKGKIIWDGSGISSFVNLEPGAEGELKFKGKILADIPEDPETKNLVIKSKARLLVTDLDEAGEIISFSKESNEVEIKINTQVNLSIEAHYYDFDGTEIGKGPLPPKVGQTTIYRIYLFLTNTTNNVRDAKVEIFLPFGVSWTGVKAVSLGDLVFSGESLVWDIGEIQAHTGKLVPQLSASFEVGITPDESQVGQKVTLVKSAKFRGIDSYTNTEINFEVGSCDTNLINDPKASGKGVVVK